jgi:drug/metabolite transporter (DMT)-like permease
METEQAHPQGLQLFLRILLLVFGVMLGATAVIMIKAGDEHPLLVASYRLLIAALVLTPFFLRDRKYYEGAYGWKELSWTVAPAVALAAHFITWVIGARLTVVANASLLANLTPVAMPFFVWLFFNERVTRQEIIGTVITLSGVVLLTLSNLRVSPENIPGDVLCLVSMLAFAVYLALGRRNGQRLTIWLYMVPLYWAAGLICLFIAVFFVNPIKSYTTLNILLILGLGLIPTVFAHTILNYSLRFFRGQVVSVTNLTQPIYAGVLGFLVFGEIPGKSFYPAAIVIFIGILIVLFTVHKKE